MRAVTARLVVIGSMMNLVLGIFAAYISASLSSGGFTWSSAELMNNAGAVMRLSFVDGS
jgi:hypothetical protein